MEDSARLAVLEGHVRDEEVFIKTLSSIQDTIETILENPHDPAFRTVKNIKELLKVDGVITYLKYIGFEVVRASEHIKKVIADFSFQKFQKP